MPVPRSRRSSYVSAGGGRRARSATCPPVLHRISRAAAWCMDAVQERDARMHGARRPLEAHIERPSRRRDVFSLGVSFIIHGLALLLLLIQSGSTGGAPAEPDVTADV